MQNPAHSGALLDSKILSPTCTRFFYTLRRKQVNSEHTHLYVGKNYNVYRFEQQNIANSCAALTVPLAASAYASIVISTRKISKDFAAKNRLQYQSNSNSLLLFSVELFYHVVNAKPFQPRRF